MFINCLSRLNLFPYFRFKKYCQHGICVTRVCYTCNISLSIQCKEVLTINSIYPSCMLKLDYYA